MSEKSAMEPDDIEKIHWNMTPVDAIAQARTYWESGHLLDAGRMLYERVPRELRREWVTRALRAVSALVPHTAEIEAVIAFAEDTEKWANGTANRRVEAHRFFDDVQRFIPEMQSKDDLFENVLLLAENAAKVIYNVYGYAAPFDHDAGWWVGAISLNIIEQVNDDELTTNVWSILSDERYITLTAPEICHPSCPVCHIWYLSNR